ncbi:MAG TPA: HD domain-containing phosphohydrolase [Terriglobales bacterium]|nr:HD domain-containing phosphohydrolase [Terriglobales bacterium]
MTERILFVDDEAAVLEGYRRILHKDFQLRTAPGGEAALADLEQNGPYAVVVSDMRMPGMNGLELLSCVRKNSPHTIRVILTGHADIDTALAAVNEEAVFRFLTKPCNPALLRRTLTTCLLQHRLLTAERELLENTLMGSIKVLTDVLSLANPAAFGRSLRINRYVQHLVRELHLEAPWRYEAAAMLSQLGCITLEPEILEAAYRGHPLNEGDRASFAHHPIVARDLLANIPRLEGIAWIVGQQSGAPCSDKEVPESIRTGAVILRVALAFDELKMQGYSDRQAIAKLQGGPTCKDAGRIVPLLTTLPPTDAETTAREIEISDLESGMVLDQEIRSSSGLLLAGKGQEVTYPLVVRLRNLYQRRAIKDKVAVLVPQNPISGTV